jgi:hypothetical protein
MSRMQRERALAVKLRASGLANAVIAERLGVSPGTVAALLRRPATFTARTCLLCGEVFTPTNGRQRYCTRAHWREHRDQQREGGPAVRECRLCGRSFTPNSAPQRYCCAEHRQEHRRHGLRPRECRLCGQTFMPTSGGQRYCTPEHQRLHSPQTVTQARERLAALEAELAQVRDQLREAE